MTKEVATKLLSLTTRNEEAMLSKRYFSQSHVLVQKNGAELARFLLHLLASLRLNDSMRSRRADLRQLPVSKGSLRVVK